MSEITDEEYEMAYKVLEQLRDEKEGVNEALFRDTHYQVQLHQEENQ